MALVTMSPNSMPRATIVCAIQRADQGDCDHPVPQFDDRVGKFQQFLGLGADDLLLGERASAGPHSTTRW
jgi:hypothetical protein